MDIRALAGHYRAELWLCLAVLVLNVLFLNHVGVFDVDEAIYTEATREMIESGDLVTPYYNYEYRWKKPPLTYWVMYPAQAVLGSTAGAARLASAVQGALCALLLALFGRFVFSRAAGLWAGAIFGTCFHGYIMGRGAVTDMTLVLWLTVCWLALFLADDRRSVPWMIVGGAAMGLATLTKGPLAIALCGGSWLTYLLLRRRVWTGIREPQAWWGIVALLVVAAPWYWAIYALHGTAFYEEFLGYHNVARFAQELEGHGGPIYTYLLMVFVLSAPWSGPVVASQVRDLRAAWQRWRAKERATRADRATLWLLVAFWLTMGLFSAAQTKLLNYIAPVYPLAALLAGRYVAQLLDGELTVKPATWWFLGGAGLLVIGGMGLVLATAELWTGSLEVIQRELEVDRLVLGPSPLVAGIILLGGVVVVALIWRRGVTQRAFFALGSLGVTAAVLAWLTFMPVFYHYQEGTLRVMAIEAQRIAGPTGEIAALNLHWPSLTLTTQRRIEYYPATNEPDLPLDVLHAKLRRRFDQPRPIVMMSRKVREKDLLVGVQHYVWADRLGYKMISNLPPPAGYELPPSPSTEAQVRRLQRGD